MEKEQDSLLQRKVITEYDGIQHCTAERHPDGNTIATDCPYTGKGEEFSPTNMVEAALGGCMLISMGTMAMRSNLDISGTKIEVRITMTDKPRMRFGAIDISVLKTGPFAEHHSYSLRRSGSISQMCFSAASGSSASRLPSSC